MVKFIRITKIIFTNGIKYHLSYKNSSPKIITYKTKLINSPKKLENNSVAFERKFNFNFCNRYLIVLYTIMNVFFAKFDGIN